MLSKVFFQIFLKEKKCIGDNRRGNCCYGNSVVLFFTFSSPICALITQKTQAETSSSVESSKKSPLIEGISCAS